MNTTRWWILPALAVAALAGTWWPSGQPAGVSLISPAHAQPGAGDGSASFRERLVTGLKLKSAQRAKLDAIMADMRPRFTALTRLDPTQRAPARAKLVSELQISINEMLTPDQRADYELMQARATVNRRASATWPNCVQGSEPC